IDAGLIIRIGNARPVTHQTSICNELAPLIDCRQCKALCPTDDLSASEIEVRIRGHDQGFDTSLGKPLERGIQRVFGPGVYKGEIDSKLLGCDLQVLRVGLHARAFWIDQNAEAAGSWYYLVEKLQPLFVELGGQPGSPRGISARVA